MRDTEDIRNIGFEGRANSGRLCRSVDRALRAREAWEGTTTTFLAFWSGAVCGFAMAESEHAFPLHGSADDGERVYGSLLIGIKGKRPRQ